MALQTNDGEKSWQTKSTDRFVLKWIKTHLSARITPKLLSYEWLRPWMITLFSSGLGVLAGFIFAVGGGWLAGCIAACAQVLDGVDGQFARITGQQSKGGAFWDSVLDRYADGAMVIGLIIYLIRLPFPWPPWLILILGALALIGSNLVSYSSARAESLGIDLGKATFYLTIYDAWGRRKLEQFQSAGLKTKVLWEKTPEEKGLRAGNIRKRMALGDSWEHMVPPATANLVRTWDIPNRLHKLYGMS